MKEMTLLERNDEKVSVLPTLCVYLPFPRNESRDIAMWFSTFTLISSGCIERYK